MLVIGGVERPRRQQRDYGIAGAGRRRHLLQRAAQLLRIDIDRLDIAGAEEFRASPHHALAVFQHVADPGGRAAIVLQHLELLLAGSHDVDADHVGIDTAGRIDADHSRLKGRISIDQPLRHDAGAQDFAPVIDILEEGVERERALADAPLQPAPLGRGEDPRDEVEGDQPLRVPALAIDGEGDADPPEDRLGLRRVPAQRVEAARLDPGGNIVVGHP